MKTSPVKLKELKPMCCSLCTEFPVTSWGVMHKNYTISSKLPFNNQGVQECAFLYIGALGERGFEPDEFLSSIYVGQILVTN